MYPEELAAVRAAGLGDVADRYDRAQAEEAEFKAAHADTYRRLAGRFTASERHLLAGLS